MTVSLFSRITARSVGVPVLDRRLRTHANFQAVVKTNDGPAAPAADAPAEAPATEQTSNATSDQQAE